MTPTQIFKSIAWEPIVSAVLADLIASSAFLSWTPVAFVLSKVILSFTDELFEAVTVFINVEAIAFRNETFKIAYERRAVQLKIIAINHGMDSEEFAEAREDHRAFLKDVAHLELSRKL